MEPSCLKRFLSVTNLSGDAVIQAWFVSSYSTLNSHGTVPWLCVHRAVLCRTESLYTVGPVWRLARWDRTHRGVYLCTVTTADNRTAVRSLQLQVNCEYRAQRSTVGTARTGSCECEYRAYRLSRLKVKYMSSS